jgi:L-fuconolactonase
MMRIDAHQHFRVYDQREYAWIDDSMASPRRDFLPNDLKPELERNGFQGSVVVQARQTLEETRWLLELSINDSFILGVVAWVDLRSPDVRSQLEALAGNPKLVGIRHIAQSEPNDRFLLQPEFLRGISLLGEFEQPADDRFRLARMRVSRLIYARHQSGGELPQPARD